MWLNQHAWNHAGLDATWTLKPSLSHLISAAYYMHANCLRKQIHIDFHAMLFPHHSHTERSIFKDFRKQWKTKEIEMYNKNKENKWKHLWSQKIFLLTLKNIHSNYGADIQVFSYLHPSHQWTYNTLDNLTWQSWVMELHKSYDVSTFLPCRMQSIGH